MFKKSLLLTLILACLLPWGKVMAQQSIPYSYGFENNDLAGEEWTATDCVSGSKITTGSKKTGTYGFNFYYSSTQYQYLISKQLNTTTYGVDVSFYYKDASTFTDMYFVVGYSTTNTDTGSFTWDLTETKAEKAADWAKYTNSFPNDTKYVAIRLSTAGSYCNLYIDDFSFTETEACSTPTDFKEVSHTATTATFEWTAIAGQNAWLIYYSTNDETPASDKVSGDGIVTVTSNPYTLEGLTEGTSYHAWIRGNCTASDNGYSSWSSICDFKPAMEVELNLYTDAATTNYYTPFYASSAGSGIGTTYNIETQFIIPSTYMGTYTIGGAINSLTFYSSYATSTTYGDAEFDVKISEVNYSSYSQDALVTITDAAFYSGILSYNDGKLTITLDRPYTYKGGNLIIDIRLTKNGSNVSMNWIVKSTVTAQSIYMNKYGSISRYNYIPKTTITYIPAARFTTEGNWNEASNWTPSGIPATTENVVLNAACTIPTSYTAQANNITLGSTGSLTIEDGGQLVHSGTGVQATVKKHIDAYTADNNGWNFIATPMTSLTINNAAHTNLVDGSATYDLYTFDQSEDDVWQNYKQGHFFTLDNGTGYLYAREEDIDIQFMGELANPASGEFDLVFDETATGNKQGVNLVGNPYPCNATVSGSCYVINGNIVESVTGPVTIAPCSGVIVKASGADQKVTFTKNPEAAAMSHSNNNAIELTLTQAVANTRGEAKTETLDNAIVSFNQGSQLGKFYFGTQNANIYIPQNGKEYAIVSAEAQGEMPVCFKAAKDGQYTITVNPEEVEVSYLHLIDNIAGTEIDLLATPSYTFNAKADDYESRFRLMFTTNSVDEISAENSEFAFISNGQLIVTGEGTLQIVDMTGRVLVTKQLSTINSQLPTANLKAGVYVLRLINGENVKTQKIVVR